MQCLCQSAVWVGQTISQYDSVRMTALSGAAKLNRENASMVECQRERNLAAANLNSSGNVQAYLNRFNEAQT